MNSNIKVSVVIPVYNVEKYLPACLDSVAGQTLKEIEIICIDDHSPDNCAQILEGYAERDSRFHIIHLPENHQQGYARNRGMEIASGKYIYLLDSDDMITENALEVLYNTAEENSLDGLFFDSQVIYDSEKLKKKYASYPAARSGSYEERVYSGMELFEEFINQCEWTCYIQRQLWNREYLRSEDIWFPEGVEHEDEVFAFEAIIAAKRVMYRPFDFFIRRYRENSVVTSPPAPKNFYGYFMDYGYMVHAAVKRGLKSDAIDANLGRIHVRLVDYYRIMSEKEDLTEWFKDEESLARFRLFEAGCRSETYYEKLTAPLKERLGSAIDDGSRIFIYGAGTIARNVWHGLSRQGIAIEGFLVTDGRNNPDVLFGRPVYEPGSFISEGEKTIAVIAVTRGYQDEIAAALESRGIKYIFFDR